MSAAEPIVNGVDVEAIPLEEIDVSDPKLYQEDTYHPYFARLRREAPVHYREDGMYGSFWSVSKFRDIMQVETKPQIYSSQAKLGGISITDRPMKYRRSSFISMDPPRHDEQRKAVSPVVGPENLKNMEGLIRQRTCQVLDGLPRGARLVLHARDESLHLCHRFRTQVRRQRPAAYLHSVCGRLSSAVCRTTPI